MGSHQRRKGAGFELEAAAALFDDLGITFARNLEQVRTAGHADLTPSNPAFPFAIECKRYASGTGCKIAWQMQAQEAASDAGKLPAVLFRFDRGPIRVSIPVRAALAHLTCDPGPDWVEVTFEAFCALSRELMASRGPYDSSMLALRNAIMPDAVGCMGEDAALPDHGESSE